MRPGGRRLLVACVLALLWCRLDGLAQHPATSPDRVVTALPLMWFAKGVQRLRLSTIGLLQYLNPTVQFAIAVLVFREPFSPAHAMAFGCIWLSLAIYSLDALALARKRGGLG